MVLGSSVGRLGTTGLQAQALHEFKVEQVFCSWSVVNKCVFAFQVRIVILFKTGQEFFVLPIGLVVLLGPMMTLLWDMVIYNVTSKVCGLWPWILLWKAFLAIVTSVWLVIVFVRSIWLSFCEKHFGQYSRLFFFCTKCFICYTKCFVLYVQSALISLQLE